MFDLQSNNNSQAALDLLADPQRRDALQLAACITSAMDASSQVSSHVVPLSLVLALSLT